MIELGTMVKTSDDPIKLRRMARDLAGASVEQFENDRFAIWTEPRSGAGIALPQGLHIEPGPEYCTVHTGAPAINYVITLEPLPWAAGTAEWELGANREAWLALHRAAALANAPFLAADTKYSVPRRFENGGIIDRRMATEQSRDGSAVRVFTNDLTGRGTFVSIIVVNRDAKPEPADMTEQEKLAWARGLLAVNLTAFPPLPQAATSGAGSAASDNEAADMVWPGPRDYPRIRCGDAGLIPLPQPRTLGELAGAVTLPADLEPMLQALAGIQAKQIAEDQFDVWVQPLRGAVVLLPHGLKPEGDERSCRIHSRSPSISYVLRVVRANSESISIAEWRQQTENETEAFARDLALTAGISAKTDPASRLQAMVPPNGDVAGYHLTGTRPDGAHALVSLVSLRRDRVLTLFAMTDLDAKAPGALPVGDRLALARGLAAVRLSTLMPPTGFLSAP
jgi:hypothetical protein